MGDPFDFSQNNPWTNLENFGFATMAAGGQPGANTLGSIGQGALTANQMQRENALQGAQARYYGAEGQGKNLSNALTLRQINLGNQLYGMPNISMPGVIDLTQPQGDQQPQPTTPSGAAGAGMPWSSNAGANVPQQTPRMAPVNQPASGGILSGFDPGATQVALGYRQPKSGDEAAQAAQILNRTGINPERQKTLEALASKGLEPYEVRSGQVRVDPLNSGYTANPEHVAGYNDQNVPTIQSWTPQPVFSGKGNNTSAAPRNAGQGVSSPKINGSGGGIRTGFSPEEQKTQDNFFGTEATNYQNAQQAKYHFAFMQSDLDNLNAHPNFLNTGAGSEWRMNFAKHTNLASQQLFGVNVYDPDKVASGESLFKESGRLGFDMSKTLGAREPGVITQMAIKLNPGMDNTPQGAQLIKNTLEEAQNRIVDERAFKTDYYEKNGYKQTKAEQTFDTKFTPEIYAKRAQSLIKPITVNTPSAAKQLLAGTKIQTPDGKIKLVPPGIGITPPQFKESFKPAALPSEPVSLTGGPDEDNE